MKFCSQCGSSLPDDAAVCGYCGAPLEAPTPQPEAAPQEPFYGGYEPQAQPNYAPQAQPNYAPQAQPNYAPQAQPNYAPQAQPNYAPQAQPNYAPQAQPGYAPVPPQPYYPMPDAGRGGAISPVGQLKRKPGLVKYILLSIITLGIYSLVVLSRISSEINIMASRYDGRKTMHYCLVFFLFSWLTLGIVPMVWYSRLSGRIGTELQRRGIFYGFGAGTYWGWGFFGSLILVGPFIYYHKLFKAMNMLTESYNRIG